ncbi:MAG: hypothetical protein IJ589_08010 [Lachnospiraceae bacterium]|nr:hypothetical protein [Lachnospiraceae bacterium]
MKDKLEKVWNLRRFLFSWGAGALMALAHFTARHLVYEGVTPPGLAGKGLLFLQSVLWGLIPGIFVYLVLLLFDLLGQVGKQKKEEAGARHPELVRWLPVILAAVIFACWIPVFLAYFPGIMSYDCHRQFSNAYKGYIFFYGLHPILHTALIRWGLLIGEFFGSYEAGIAVYSLVQMLVLSLILGYSCQVVTRITGKLIPAFVMMAVYALVPFHPVLAMCVTKDIYFSAFFLLTVLLIWESFQQHSRGARFLICLGMIASGILSAQFRNNAIYAYAVFGILAVLFGKGHRMKALICGLCIVLGAYGAGEGLYAVIGAIRGPKIEMASVPLAQMSRAAVLNYTDLDEETMAILDKYFPDNVWTNYNPIIIDAVKSMVPGSVWFEDTGETLSAWARMGCKYPNEYLDAFLVLNVGYWYMEDRTHAESLGYGDDTEYGLIYTFNYTDQIEDFEGVKNISYLPGLKAVYAHVLNGNAYENWPVLKYLFKPALYFWLLLLSMLALWYLRKYRALLFSFLPFLYQMTMFLGPTVNFRYIYPLAITVPVFLALVFGAQRK